MTFFPGRTVGILGDGQLARMLAFEGRRMGFDVAVYGPTPDGPGGQIASSFVQGTLDDPEQAARFAATCDVVTLETEHIAQSVLRAVEQARPLRPSAAVLATIQDRLTQKRFLERHGLPQAQFVEIDAADPLTGLDAFPFPAIVKTRAEGYDGKGQVRVAKPSDLPGALDAIAHRPALLETVVAFEREISIVLARDPAGNVRFYPIAENEHRNHILHLTRAPARVDAATTKQAEEIGVSIARALDYIGVMAVELFAMADGRLLVNEIAPRVHNSGHFTWGGCATSQFEQHLRAVCGLPLGDTTLLEPTVMVNLLGDDWIDDPTFIERIVALPDVRLHLYGKHDVRRGRKMGHAIVLGPDMDRALKTANTLVNRAR